MKGKVDEKEKEKAILFLMEKIPKDSFQEIWNKIKNEGEGSISILHHGFGTRIRNLLRDGGFRWGAIELDMEWDSILIEAARRMHEKD